MTEEKISVLVVDDEPVNLMLLGQMLKSKGYDVVSASGGEKALDILANTQIHIVLLDIVMPDVSGFEVLKKIRQTKNRVAMPVIMLSAKDESDDIVKALDLGANDYITKPVDPIVVEARIRVHLHK